MSIDNGALNSGLLWDPTVETHSDHFLIRFRIDEGAASLDTAFHFARLLSTSCAVRLQGETDDLRRRRAAKVVEVSLQSITLAFPAINITGQIVDLLLCSYIDTNTNICRVLELAEICLPKRCILQFERAPFGGNLYEAYARPNLPLLIGVVKPSIGLTVGEHVSLVEEAFRGGCDVLKDDENLVPADPDNGLYERVAQIAPKIKQLRLETGRPLLYIFNIHSDTDAEEYISHLESFNKSEIPIFGALVSPILGLPYIRRLRRVFSGPLFCHSTGIALFVSGSFKLSYRAYIQMLRLCGVDSLIHAPPFSDKWQCAHALAVEINDYCMEPMHGLPSMLLSFGGGLGVGNFMPIRKLLGSSRFGYIVGGAIFAHPEGPHVGASCLLSGIESAALQR